MTARRFTTLLLAPTLLIAPGVPTAAPAVRIDRTSAPPDRHAWRRRTRLAALGILALVIGVTVAGPTAHAKPSSVHCGDTVTADLRLTHDLINCPNRGLVVGADHVTIDLAGHTIDGDDEPSANCDTLSCDVGIDNTAGHRDIRVHDGAIRQFGIGAVFMNATHGDLRRLTVIDSADLGVLILDSHDLHINRNRLADNGTSGIVVVRSQSVTVSHNAVTGSHGFAIPLLTATDSRITANRMRHNDHGIGVMESSSRNLVRGNLITRGGGASIDIGGGDVADNRILDNRILHNGDGIIMGQAHNNLVSRNVMVGTGFTGFPDAGGFSLLLDGANRNTLSQNHITDGRGPAIWVTTFESPTPPRGNVVSRNLANSRLDDGIRVDGGAAGTLLYRNVANDNADDGIEADTAGTTLTGNTADHNADLGIEAIPGVIDGGHNQASGNVNPAECLNVQCSQ